MFGTYSLLGVLWSAADVVQDSTVDWGGCGCGGDAKARGRGKREKGKMRKMRKIEDKNSLLQLTHSLNVSGRPNCGARKIGFRQ